MRSLALDFPGTKMGGLQAFNRSRGHRWECRQFLGSALAHYPQRQFLTPDQRDLGYSLEAFCLIVLGGAGMCLGCYPEPRTKTDAHLKFSRSHRARALFSLGLVEIFLTPSQVR